MDKINLQLNKAFVLIILLTFVKTYGQDISTSQVIYNSTDEIFINPERGFSTARSFALNLSTVNNARNSNISVIQRIYTIPQFNNTEFSQDFLNLVESDLNFAREGGIKLVLRFSYTNNQNGADASLELILKQIKQLEPVFAENYDVIAYIEAGFIGAWGEWYYSSNGLNNTSARRTVLLALLDALPVERSVVVRTPDYKRKIFNDVQPLTIEEAFDGSYKSRTGAHNDCFLASISDFGTYIDNNIEGDKNYLNLDNRFVPQGGETCNPSSYSVCDNALSELERMHWSVLNRDYHQTVLNGWETGGCMDEVKRRLGYRFTLLEAEIIDSIKPGGTFVLKFDLLNQGLASPYNKRNLEVILREENTNKTYRLLTKEDPRFWLSGDTAHVEIYGGIPDNMHEGLYSVFISLPDPEPTIHDRVDYAIRLANENVWEDSTGYNYLLHDIEINNNVDGYEYSGDSFFELYGSNNQNPDTEIIIDGNFNDWGDVALLDIEPDNEQLGDAFYNSADLEDLWITDDEEWFYISYKLAGDYSSSYFYHVFFDTDNNSSTGFHSGESYAGIDYMIENNNLWEYTGQNGEWGWSSKGEIQFHTGVTQTNRIELAVSKQSLSLAGTYGTIGILFNVNDNDEGHDDDYAPNDYKQKSYMYSSEITSVDKHYQEVITSFSLSAYPNPFNNEVVLQVKGDFNKITTASIYDVLGRKVKSFLPAQLYNGRIFWDGKNNNGGVLSTGTYFFCIQSEGIISAKKLMLLK